MKLTDKYTQERRAGLNTVTFMYGYQRSPRGNGMALPRSGTCLPNTASTSGPLDPSKALDHILEMA